ncbi:toll-like receptor 13 [Spea bombifrons]|uniref:toll-like receptor 13 n=1 Tax=Spea bombifrons TaxID=233779 RepID=UPI002349CCE5|nr:toll-like receptor 13 [Spea bombifrons]
MSLYRLTNHGIYLITVALHCITLTTGYGYSKCYLPYNNNKYADCVGRRVVALTSEIRNLPNETQWLNMSQNEIRIIEDHAFSHLPNLLEIQLSKNRIHTIQHKAFQNLNNLQLLDLSQNLIESLDSLTNLTSLRILCISHNKIFTIQSEILRPLQALEELNLASNLISDFRMVAKALTNLYMVSKLNLSSNTISNLSSEQRLIKLPSLQYLILCNNTISVLDLSYYFMPNLIELNVLRNNMSRINGSSLQNVPNLSKIVFDENPLNISQLLGSWLPNLTELHWSSMRPAPQHDLSVACQVFQSLPLLRWLELKHCKISSANLKVIGQCTNLTTLVLSTSSFIRMVNNSLQSFEYLQVLHLDSCKVKQINVNAWNGLKALHTLNLERNRLSVLKTNMFSPLSKLRVLDLSKNYVTYIDKDAFKGLYHLRYLSLRSCKIAYIKEGKFMYLRNLRVLDLRENSLSVIRGKSFHKLRKLQTLLLSGNKISSIQKYALQGLSSLEHLSLADNGFYKLTNFTLQFLKSLVTLDLSKNQLWAFNKYQSPNPFLYLKQLKSLDLSYQTQTFSDISVPATLFKGLQSLQKLNLRGNPCLFFKNKSLTLLANLTELDISELYPMTDHSDLFKPELFQNLTQLRHLNADKNEIRDLPENIFSHVTLLENLSLKYNKLRNISKSILENVPNLVYCDVYMNPLSCSCENCWFQNWSEFNTVVQVPFIQSYNCFGQRAQDNNFINYDLSFCGTDISVYFFFGTFFTTSLFLIVSLLIVKLKWSILYGYYMLRVWFKWKIQKEERACRYDAFISYSSEDEQWVVENLLFQLEEQGKYRYKLCFKPRDFVPGCYHIENIQEAISNSRKTMCIVSRHYLTSEWCRIEMEMACSRVFFQKEDVLLLVFLEDIPDYRLSAYHKLRKLIKQNTYLHWPEDPQGEELFWFKLSEALGKEMYEEDTIQLGVARRAF